MIVLIPIVNLGPALICLSVRQFLLSYNAYLYKKQMISSRSHLFKYIESKTISFMS